MAKYENKTKQNKTKQNTLQCKKFSHSLAGTLKGAVILLFVLSTMFVSSAVYAQPPVPPAGHGTSGTYPGEPLYVGPLDGAFWTFDFSEFESECEGVFGLYTFFTVQPYGSDEQILIPIDNSTLTGITTLDAQTIIAASNGKIANNQGFYITHMSFYVVINGQITNNAFYPNDNARIPTGLPAPCDCIQVFFHTSSKTIYFGPSALPCGD